MVKSHRDILWLFYKSIVICRLNKFILRMKKVPFENTLNRNLFKGFDQMAFSYNNKVEICGVNTSSLPVLKEAQKMELL